MGTVQEGYGAGKGLSGSLLAAQTSGDSAPRYSGNEGSRDGCSRRVVTESLATSQQVLGDSRQLRCYDR